MQIDGPDAWTTAMLRGDFAQAWTVSDKILAEHVAAGDFDYTLPRHQQTIWTGCPLEGKHVLVRCYHGLGDTVQFVRFAKPLRAIAREVTIWVQPQLMRLVAGVDGVDSVLPLHDGTPGITYDADIEVMELAHALRATSSDLAKEVPYIRPPTPVNIRLDGGMRVGLIWAVAGTWAPERSLAFPQLSALLDVPEVAPIVLQRGPAAEEARHFPVNDFGSDDIATFAATLAALDLLISIDTFGAHLAGAMGVPTWIMLKADCDWRWMSTGRTSPWYPSMRLYRQPAAGDWPSVVAEIARDLGRAAAARSAT